MARYDTNYIKENFISVKSVMELLNIKNRGSTTISFVTSKLLNEGPNIDVEVVELDEKLELCDGLFTAVAAKRSDIANFSENYISIAELKKQIPNTTLLQLIEESKTIIVKLQQTVSSGMFIKKSVLDSEEAFINYFGRKKLKADNAFIIKKNISKALKLNTRALDLVLAEYHIEIKTNNNFFGISKQDLEFLITKQKEALSLLDKYYFASEAMNLLGRTFSKDENNFERIKCPIIIPTTKGADKSGTLWKKSDVDAFLIDRINKRESIELNKVFLDDPYATFVYRLNISYTKNLSFVPQTKNLWLHFIKNRFASSEANETTQNKKISNYIEISKTLFENIDIEVYKMTTNDINLRILNEHIAISHRFVIFLFLKSVATMIVEEGKNVKYRVHHLLNPYDSYEPNPSDTSCYSLDQYQQLFNYAKQVEIHKIRAIKDVQSFVNTGDTRDYRKYDSVWLYVLIILSNNWRHSTVLSQLPRIDLSRTRVSSLSWLSENDLSIDEARDIIYQVGRYTIHIEKTGAEGSFRVPETLELAFAIAITICEFRIRMTSVDITENIIYFSSDKTLTSRSPGSFFKHYPDPNFKLENRKMSRTFTTLIWSVIRHHSNNSSEALDASKVSRAHLTDASTNIYIKLSQEQLDTLTHQLFSRDHFGFIYKLFSDILYGESDNKMIETKRILALKEEFGSIYKVEATVGFINRITAERKEIENWILSKSPEQMWEDYYAILTNQLPAKEKNYQCINRSCIKPELHCSECSLSIPNVYALSYSLDKYIKQIENMMSFDELPLGEKMRQSNQLFMILETISAARAHFGDEVVYSFVKGGKERLADLQKLIPPKSDVKQYSTFMEASLGTSN